MTRLDTHEIAALVRIYGTSAEQAALLRQLRIIRGQLCPECGAEEAESNGCAGSDEEFRCCTCDHRWAPVDIALELPAAAPVDDADFDAAECKGHPAGSHGVMGQTTCSCRRGHGPLDFDPFATTSATPPPRPRLKGTGPRSLNRDDASVAERDNRRVLKGGQ